MGDEYSEAASAKFIVWVDYGQEGWRPKPFDSLEDAYEAILRCDFGGAALVTPGHIKPLDGKGASND